MTILFRFEIKQSDHNWDPNYCLGIFSNPYITNYVIWSCQKVPHVMVVPKSFYCLKTELWANMGPPNHWRTSFTLILNVFCVNLCVFCLYLLVWKKLTESKEAVMDPLWANSHESSDWFSVFITSLQGVAAQKFQLSEKQTNFLKNFLCSWRSYISRKSSARRHIFATLYFGIFGLDI